MIPATVHGKPKALEALAERRARFAGSATVDNASLYAGFPMYFRCIACGDPHGVCVPESYLEKPDLCPECAALKRCGWLE